MNMNMLTLVVAIIEQLPKIVAAVEAGKTAEENAVGDKAKVHAAMGALAEVIDLLSKAL